MYYFKEIKTLRIVTRDHQYNMEVIDGKLVEIEPMAPCLLLAHVPNKAWSYDVTILEKLDAETGIRRLDPLPQVSDQPKEFYAVVLENDFEEYAKEYRQIKGIVKEPKPEDIIKANPKPKIIEITPETINEEPQKTINTTAFGYEPTLRRSGEKTVYKFTPGSERYG